MQSSGPAGSLPPPRPFARALGDGAAGDPALGAARSCIAGQVMSPKRLDSGMRELMAKV